MLSFQAANELTLAYVPDRFDHAGRQLIAVVNPTSLLRPSVPAGRHVLEVFCTAAEKLSPVSRLLTFAQMTGFLEDLDLSWDELEVDWARALAALDVCGVSQEIDLLHIYAASHLMIAAVGTTPRSKITLVDTDGTTSPFTAEMRQEALQQVVAHVNRFVSEQGPLQSYIEFRSAPQG